MNETMTGVGPRPGTIFREQLRIIGESLRWEIVAIGLMIVGFIVAHSIAYRIYGGTIDAEIALVGVFGHWIGVLAAIGVWKGHTPSRRGYFWSLPIDRQRNTLSMVAAGWVWMAGLVAAVIAGYIVLALIAGGSIMMGPTMPIDGHYWIWLLPFVTSSFGYVFGSAVMIATEHPWRVLIGIWFFWLVLFGLSGLVVPISPAAVDTLLYGYLGYYKFVQGMEMNPGVRWQPDLFGWIASTALWMTPGVMLLWWAVRRYRES